MTSDAWADVAATAVAAWEIPGAAVGVLDHGEITTWCTGVTSVTNPLPVHEQTVFQLASISKTFVATTAMVLRDRGQLDIDLPIVTYVPDLRLSSEGLTQSVTMRHLLTHTTGWAGDFFADTGTGADALALFVAKLVKAPQLTAPGELYSYCNSAFNLAAHVIARAAGEPYERVVKDVVLRPLGMRTTFYGTDDAITRRVAIGHRNGAPQPWRRPLAHSGASGVLSCVDDLLRYATFHLGDGAPLMGRDSFDLMHTPQRAAGSLCDEVGLAWMIDRHEGELMIHHGGSSNGFQCDLRLVPSRELAWVMLTNGDHHHQLDRVLRAELVGPEPAADHVPADLAPFCGRYEAVLAHLTVRAEGNQLWVEVATPPHARYNPDEPEAPVETRLAFRDADRVVALDMPAEGQRGEFVRGADGSVEWFRWDGRLARRVG